MKQIYFETPHKQNRTTSMLALLRHKAAEGKVVRVVCREESVAFYRKMLPGVDVKAFDDNLKGRLKAY